MTLVFLLEERSMKAFLEGLLPRILPAGVDYKLIPHEGKSDLEKSIPRKLRGWREPEARFVVVRDQDSADCVALKRKLGTLCASAGPRPTLVRIACRELESWYLADLKAVDSVYGTKLAARQDKEKLRTPDKLGSPSKVLAELVPAFGKVSGARQLGPMMDLDNTRSPSFAHLVRGVRAFAAAP